MRLTEILLADDHEVVRRGLRAVLETEPRYVIVGEAVDGVDAVEKATRLKPDVVILDIAMPRMDGLEAARHITKGAPGTKVLILTIHDSETVAGEALQAGARGYLLKSDAGWELLKALDSLALGKPFFTPSVASMVIRGFGGEIEGTPENPGAPTQSTRKKDLLPPGKGKAANNA